MQLVETFNELQQKTLLLTLQQVRNVNVSFGSFCYSHNIDEILDSVPLNKKQMTCNTWTYLSGDTEILLDAFEHTSGQSWSGQFDKPFLVV